MSQQQDQQNIQIQQQDQPQTKQSNSKFGKQFSKLDSPQLNQQTKNGKRFIVFFTVLMPTNCMILETFVIFYFNIMIKWMNEPLENNKFEYYFSFIFAYFVYSMAMISYYQAIMIENDYHIKVKNLELYFFQQPQISDASYLEDVYKNDKSCQKCQKWKPQRAHHCSICNTCTLKMDHHCPWTINCVGLRNHRAFYLFTIYMTLGALQYCYRSIYYMSWEMKKQTLWDHNWCFYIFWTFTSIILFPVCFLLVLLTIYHSLLMISNLTTLEQMSGVPMKLNLNLFPQQKINLFDKGIIPNIAYFFEFKYLTWWIPTKNYSYNDGTKFNINPSLSLFQFKKQYQNVSDSDNQENTQEYINQITMQFSGKNLRFGEKIFTIE